MKDVMVDLETRGFVPGCGLASIGAVGFDRAGVEHEFYVAVRAESCKQHDLFDDSSTMEWWARQSPEAQAVLADPAAVELKQALTLFNDWLRDNFSHDVRVWGNGADFDNGILAAAYRAAGVPQGWKPYNGRCYRTVKQMAPAIKLKRGGTHHNALDDARSQAEHMVVLVNELNLLLN